jgi:hypothetical protein
MAITMFSKYPDCRGDTDLLTFSIELQDQSTENTLTVIARSEYPSPLKLSLSPYIDEHAILDDGI